MNKENKEIVKIFDTTLRDGEQTPGVNLITGHKLKLAKKLDKLILNIPEMLLVEFTQGLTPKYKKILKKI